MLQQTNNIIIHATGGKRVGGILDQKTKTLKKIVTSKHYLRHPEVSLACDTEVLRQARDMGAEWCQFTDRETGVIFKTPIETFLLAGDDIDFGFGAQKKLPISVMIKIKPGQPERPAQMALPMG